MAITEFDQSRRGCELNTSSTMNGVGLGIVCHAENHYGTGPKARRYYRSTVYEFLGVSYLISDFYPFFRLRRSHPPERFRKHFHQVGGDHRMLTQVLPGNIPR